VLRFSRGFEREIDFVQFVSLPKEKYCLGIVKPTKLESNFSILNASSQNCAISTDI